MRYFLSTMLLFMATPALAETLDAKAIQNQLIGQHITWWDAQGDMTGDLILLPSGDAQLTVNAPTTASDKGQWTLQGNQLCTIWSRMRAGTAKCYTLRETLPGHFITSGGNEFALQEIAV